MKPKLCLTCIIVFLLSSLAWAQEQTLDPDQVFAPSVDIRIIESLPEPSNLDYDDVLRLLLINDDIIPYPDEVTSIWNLSEIDDRYLMRVELTTHSEYQSALWEYEPNTGQFKEFEPYCSPLGQYGVESLSDQPWTISQLGDDWVLCNIFNGEQTQALPNGYDWIIDTFAREPQPQVTLSPDREIIAFMGTDVDTLQVPSNREVYLFSYQFNTQTFLNLGQFRAEESLYFTGWLYKQVMLNTGNTTSVGFICTLITDTTQVDDIYQTLCDTDAEFVDNPPRLVLSAGHLTNGGGRRCNQTTYDLTTHEITRLELDGLCRPEYGDIEAVGYYRDVPVGQSIECCVPAHADVAEVPLVRYDTRTGERQELYRGEIESIEWVSDDERYAILILDNNGEINLFPYLQFGIGETHLPFVTLIDQQTGDTLARTTKDDWRTGTYDWLSQYGIFSLGDGRFISIECTGVTACRRENREAFLITITATGVDKEFIVDDPAQLLPNHRGLFIWSQPYQSNIQQQDTIGINIYDLATGGITPFIRDDIYRGSDLQLFSEADDLIRVSAGDQQYDVRFEPDGSFYVEIIEPPESAIAQHVCVVTTNEAVNIRSGAGANTDRVSGAIADETFLAVNRQISDNDQMTWYELDTGGWLREDYLRTSSGCATLDTTTQQVETGDDNVTPEPVAVCQVKLLYDVNLRTGAGQTFEVGGSRLSGEQFDIKAQAMDEQNFRWWQLDNAGVDTDLWIREDLTEEIGTCDTLPTVATN